MHGITVAQLIEYLQKQPQDLLVCHGMYSEQILLNTNQIIIVELSKPRPDSWIQDKRSDKDSQTYLKFPGN